VRDPKNEHGVGSPTTNPKGKEQCKYKNKVWIRSKRTEQQAMVITNDSKRTISKPGLFQGCTRQCKLQRNSVKSPMRVKQPSLQSDSCKASTTKNQMGAKGRPPSSISSSRSDHIIAGRLKPTKNKIKTEIHKNNNTRKIKKQQKNPLSNGCNKGPSGRRLAEELLAVA
jgi:hypothetical protein